MASPFLKRYLLALNRYKWPALASFLGVVGVSGIIALQPPPPVQYRTEGVLVQNFPLVAFSTTGTEVQARGQGIISEEALLSDVLLQQVSQELERQGINIRPSAIRSNTQVRLEGQERDQEQIQQVAVAFTWPNDEEAQATLSLLFDGMVELSRVTNRSRLQAILEALDGRLPEIEQDLRTAEQALEQYDRLEGPAIQAALDGSLLGAISGSEQQRRQNQITLAGIEAQMQSLQAQLGLTPEQAFTSSALSADPIIAQLRAQILETETQIELLSPQLRPAHPTLQDLRNNLQAYNQLLQQRAQEVIGGNGLNPLPSSDQVRQNSALDPARAALANQLVNFQTQRDALIQQTEVLASSEVQMRQQYAGLPNKQLERDRLAQQVALQRALYDQIQAKRIDAQAAEAETVSSLRVAIAPTTSVLAEDPQNPLMIWLAGGLLGLVAAGGVVFLLDMLDGTLRTYDDLQALLRDQEVPLLGLIPAMRTRSPRILPLLLQPDSPYGDAYERLRSNLRLMGSQTADGTVPRMILVTSTRDQEGKTTTAFNLAIASAHAGRRTLVIEGDLRLPSQARRLGVNLSAQAQAEPLRYYGGKVGDPIQMVPRVENLYIAPSPGPQQNAVAILESSEMKRFLEDARGRFDMVIIDAPPLVRSNDAILLEGLTDGLVLVTRPGLTEKAVLEAALEQLLDTEDLRLLGAVINGAYMPVAAMPHSESRATDEDDLLPPSSLPPTQPPVGSRVDF
ncbi:tyrosine-protein kinase domain-containing protein [Pseudanabaena sp. FACHB-2040]|uniref:GumC family protein n=1 Tax=Pseudanabaena sp. FACHB-2040 TaxID=2692859 RepID=UPI0016832934|nr:tyrosine-protein kinase domain-containing protein [Pseudanabaena sp. FACHB-2040]MBD2260645.1 AAA family ATPase [Pseudanabaena sp. FACHB-2040]